ncbi:MAG: TorF family putative porin [Magnetococcus sp. YQC-3]
MTTLYKFPAIVGWLGIAVCAGYPFSGLADATTAPPQTHTFTANMGVVSNYIFRGQTQTWNRPAFQGGVDYSHADGWYAGLWTSNISDRQYAGGWAELDYYGGYNGKFNDDWSWTLGVNGAYYPTANYDRVNPVVAVNGNQSYDNFEVNAGLGYKWITLKVYASLTDYFGANTSTGYKSDSKGTTYWDLSANVPLPEEYFTKDVTLPLHIGRTE